MPIYEYHCSSCSDNFEVSQKITDGPLKECPKCRGAVEKLVSATSFVLKGGGWYASDYGRKGGEGAVAKDGKESGGTCVQGGSKPACAGCPSAAG